VGLRWLRVVLYRGNPADTPVAVGLYGTQDKVEISVEFLEIYQEEIYDLLSQQTRDPGQRWAAA
jgi:hypothetical protein